MRCMPRARVTVTTAGRPSGIAATASAMAMITTSDSGVPRRSPSTKIRAMMAMAMAERRLPSPSS